MRIHSLCIFVPLRSGLGDTNDSKARSYWSMSSGTWYSPAVRFAKTLQMYSSALRLMTEHLTLSSFREFMVLKMSPGSAVERAAIIITISRHELVLRLESVLGLGVALGLGYLGLEFG